MARSSIANRAPTLGSVPTLCRIRSARRSSGIVPTAVASPCTPSRAKTSRRRKRKSPPSCAKRNRRPRSPTSSRWQWSRRSGACWGSLTSSAPQRGCKEDPAKNTDRRSKSRRGKPDSGRVMWCLPLHDPCKRQFPGATRFVAHFTNKPPLFTTRNLIMENFNEFLASPFGLIVAGVAAFVIGSMFFNVKQWEAHWKQWAIDTSKAMSKAGLIHTPKILDSLAVGDLAAAFREIKGLADVFKDPKQLAAEFATVFQNMLDAAFKDPTQAKALQQLANDAVAAFASGDPTKAEGKLAADAQAVLSASPLFGPIAQHGLQLPSLQLLPHVAAN